MKNIILGIKEGQNCLLESPTGSGKTLSLLCSTLAWFEFESEQRKNRSLERKIPDSFNCDCNQMVKTEIKIDENNQKFKETCACSCYDIYDVENEQKRQSYSAPMPQIYYATRTHKQIANVIKEYRKTEYAKTARMTILSSRQQSCVHPQVSKSSNKDGWCKKLRKNEAKNDDGELKDGCGCSHYDKFQINLPLVYEKCFEEPVWDIEDLKNSKLVKETGCCAYYVARVLRENVRIIFTPYNYLIDPSIRSSMNIELTNSIVIIDEAHNIEDFCRESATFNFTKLDLECSIYDLNKYCYDSNLTKTKKDAVLYFVHAFEELIDWINRNTLIMYQNEKDSEISKKYSGSEIVTEFKTQGIGPGEQFNDFVKNLSLLKKEDEDEDLPIEDENKYKVASEANIDETKALAEKLGFLLEFLYTSNKKGQKFMDDYKVAIIKDKTKNFNQDDEIFGTQSKRKSKSAHSEWSYTVNFWCLNPEVAFHHLSEKCRSVILCSGTLSPMDTFSSELGTKFEYELEAKHVISEKQVWVGSIGYGPNNYSLCANKKSQESVSFQDELGRLILDVCKTIPFGVLCFVPSYSLLNKLLDRWRENGTLKDIKDFKQIFLEDKKTDFNDLLKRYYHCIETSKESEKQNGGFFIGVFRGKASEGLDFSDNLGRAVIAVGIPYPSFLDVQVVLKKEYNNKRNKESDKEIKLLSGEKWYDIQAYRAVNQALGRVIRHKDDWGAIILVDERYVKQTDKHIAGLSKWIRNMHKSYPSYDKAINSLKDFSLKMKNFSANLYKPTQSFITNRSREHTAIKYDDEISKKTFLVLPLTDSNSKKRLRDKIPHSLEVRKLDNDSKLSIKHISTESKENSTNSVIGLDDDFELEINRTNNLKKNKSDQSDQLNDTDIIVLD